MKGGIFMTDRELLEMLVKGMGEIKKEVKI